MEMQVDMKGHGISVQAHENVNIYQSTTSLTVGGEGFRPSPDSTKFRFGNTLTLAANYTVDVTESSATFTLVKGSKWRQVTFDAVVFLCCTIFKYCQDLPWYWCTGEV